MSAVLYVRIGNGTVRVQVLHPHSFVDSSGRLKTKKKEKPKIPAENCFYQTTSITHAGSQECSCRKLESLTFHVASLKE